jgi:hypothetical protein
MMHARMLTLLWLPSGMRLEMKKRMRIVGCMRRGHGDGTATDTINESFWHDGKMGMEMDWKYVSTIMPNLCISLTEEKSSIRQESRSWDFELREFGDVVQQETL